MPEHHFSEDQRDCMQEICNVAMGQAGDGLARQFGVFVTLSIPKIRIIPAKDLSTSLQNFDSNTGIYASVQLFSSKTETSQFAGLALVVLPQESIEDLSSLLHSSVGDAQDILLGDTCHKLAETCIDALAEQWGLSFACTEPDISNFEVVNNVCSSLTTGWDQLLLVEINYKIEGRDFNGDLLLLFPDDAIDSVATKLDALLAD